MRIYVRTALGVLVLGCAASALAQTSAPQTIRIGETARGVIEAREKETSDRGWLVDFFDFNATRGERVTITLRSTSFDAYLDLDRNDSHLESDDDSGGGEDGTDARLVYEPETSGVHRINVTSVENKSTGAYSLTLERGGEVTVPAQTTTPRSARQSPAATPIRPGQTLDGRIGPLSPLHTDDTPYMPYSFTGRRGQHVIIEMKASAFDAYVVLMRDGDEVGTDDDGGEGTDARLFVTLPADGTYEIRANVIEANSTGAFTLSLAESATPPPPRAEPSSSAATRRPIAPPARSTPLAVGDTVRGTLQASDQKGDGDVPYDAFKIRGQARQKVLISMNSDAFDGKLILLDAVGNQLADNDDENGTDPAISYTLPANGDYYALATGLNASDAGAYSITLSREAPAR